MKETKRWENLPTDSIKILDYLSEHRQITIAKAIEITETPRATLKLRLNHLMNKGIILRIGIGRGTRYILK
jgi:uncharacterized membrane protein